MSSEGPFDGIIGFSNGALLAANMIIEDTRLGTLDPNLKLVILLSPPRIDNLGFSKGKVDEILIHLPSAHVWGSNDTICSDTPSIIADICARDVRSTFVHNCGHEIPGGKDKEMVIGVVRVIRRAINAAA